MARRAGLQGPSHLAAVVSSLPAASFSSSWVTAAELVSWALVSTREETNTRRDENAAVLTRGGFPAPSSSPASVHGTITSIANRLRVAPAHWQVAVAAFSASVATAPTAAQRDPSAAKGDSTSSVDAARLADVFRKVSPDAVEHLYRNLSVGDRWREMLVAYDAFLRCDVDELRPDSAAPPSARGGEEASSSLSSYGPAFRRYALMALLPVERRLWAPALSMLQHTLRHRDRLHSGTVARLIRNLGDAGQWRQAAAVMDACSRWLQRTASGPLVTSGGSRLPYPSYHTPQGGAASNASAGATGGGDRAHALLPYHERQLWSETFGTGLCVIAGRAAVASPGPPSPSLPSEDPVTRDAFVAIRRRLPWLEFSGKILAALQHLGTEGEALVQEAEQGGHLRIKATIARQCYVGDWLKAVSLYQRHAGSSALRHGGGGQMTDAAERACRGSILAVFATRLCAEWSQGLRLLLSMASHSHRRVEPSEAKAICLGAVKAGSWFGALAVFSAFFMPDPPSFLCALVAKARLPWLTALSFARSVWQATAEHPLDRQSLLSAVAASCLDDGAIEKGNLVVERMIRQRLRPQATVLRRADPRLMRQVAAAGLMDHVMLVACLSSDTTSMSWKLAVEIFVARQTAVTSPAETSDDCSRDRTVERILRMLLRAGRWAEAASLYAQLHASLSHSHRPVAGLEDKASDSPSSALPLAAYHGEISRVAVYAASTVALLQRDLPMANVVSQALLRSLDEAKVSPDLAALSDWLWSLQEPDGAGVMMVGPERPVAGRRFSRLGALWAVACELLNRVPPNRRDAPRLQNCALAALHSLPQTWAIALRAFTVKSLADPASLTDINFNQAFAAALHAPHDLGQLASAVMEMAVRLGYARAFSSTPLIHLLRGLQRRLADHRHEPTSPRTNEIPVGPRMGVPLVDLVLAERPLAMKLAFMRATLQRAFDAANATSSQKSDAEQLLKLLDEAADAVRI